jgi:hypothetical protein
MHARRILLAAVPALALGLLLATTTVAPAQPLRTTGTPLVALTVSNRLVHFDSLAPGMVHGSVAVNGLRSGETLLAIDYRPATGQLVGLGSSSRLYAINAMTGDATAVGSTSFDPLLAGAAFGFDFNPTVDRIRGVSDSAQDLRLHPDTGAVAAVDGALVYAAGDANHGIAPSIVGSAYTNNVPGATSTTLFGIDSNLSVLVTQTPPNDGILNTVGPLGMNITDLVGFDIESGTDFAFAALRTPGAATSGLYTINLTTGSASLVGPIGGTELIRGLAVVIQPRASS